MTDRRLDEARQRAEEALQLVNAKPYGMRASSGVWLRGQVYWLANDVLVISDRLAAAEKALRNLEYRTDPDGTDGSSGSEDPYGAA